ncbi:hypothetical protein OAU50_00475 [Planctomycetota bacterium]|nr:hypothetical protein [Planctomycetota bacterium]
MKFDNIIKAVFAVAVLLAASTYAFNTYFSEADEVRAAGVDSASGWDITPLGAGRQGGFFLMTRYVQDPATGEPTQTITVYELVKKGQSGEADLFYVGSRVVDHDAGLPMLKFDAKADSDWNPDKMKEYMEKASKGGSKKRR